MTNPFTPTCQIKGFFIGAHDGEPYGNLYQLHDFENAEDHGTYLTVVETYTEILPDGSEVRGEDFLYLEPAKELPYFKIDLAIPAPGPLLPG